MKFLLIISIILFYSCSTTKKLAKSDYLQHLYLSSSQEQIRKLNIAKKQLIMEAEKSLLITYKTIIDKEIIAPNGNVHDYVSIAIYFWPNENDNNGPWLFKDGKVNHDVLERTGHKNYYDMLGAVKTLSLSYHITKNEKYAKKSFELISKWFINKKTKMNPHFKYAQGIPGKTVGTPSGIIDSRGILWIISSINLLKDSYHFKNFNINGFIEWCNQLFIWLRNSDFGERESKTSNNHSTFYDLQIATLASYLGKDNVAKTILDSTKIKRIKTQILTDGSQPHELKRANGYMYSIFNLSAFIHLARLGENYNIDLWDFKTDNCGSIKEALDYLIVNSFSNNGKFIENKYNKNEFLKLLPIANNYYKGLYLDYIREVIVESKIIDLRMLYFVS